MSKSILTVAGLSDYPKTDFVVVKKINNPSIQDLIQAVQGLRFKCADRLNYYDGFGTIVCYVVAENRIQLDYTCSSLDQGGILLDASMLDKMIEVQVADEAIQYAPIYETVPLEYAIEVLTYYYNEQRFPNDSLWYGRMEKLKK